jgi:serine/threonine-protein kinase
MVVARDPLPPEFWEDYDSTQDIGAAPAAPAAAAPRFGPQLIGRYRVIHKLGEGGMGEVFLAYDETLARKVALKRIRPDRADRAEFRRRFEVEARVTGLLQHPSIVPVYELGSDGADPFYTMRLVEGEGLDRLLQRLGDEHAGAREEWPALRLLRYFLQAAYAIAYAHSRGVIHRDLKPSNIMLGPFEQVLVLDWGMAKILSHGEDEPDSEADLAALRVAGSHTASKGLLGTLAFMSPEQLRGEPATFKSDIFSLGIILYELLALRAPWGGRTVNERLAAMRQAPEPPSRLQPARGISAEWNRVALKALAVDPAERYASVSAFSAELAHALEGRAHWSVERESLERSRWRHAGLVLVEERGALRLRSRGAEGRFRYFCAARFPDDVRVEFEFQVPKGRHELSVCLNAVEPRGRDLDSGYHFAVLSGRRRTLSLLRSGRVVAGAHSPDLEPRRWYRCAATREDGRFSLALDGEELYVYHDPIPLSGGSLGLAGTSPGLGIRGLRVLSRGTSAMVSCLAVPDAFFHRKLFEAARAEYERIALSQPGRDEGRVAGFRAGLSMLEMARTESDGELRDLLLDEAGELFSRLQGANESCLLALGKALVAGEKGKPAAKHEALRQALEEYPGDPHLPIVREWLLGRLHALDLDAHRRTLVELLPLAVAHCMGDVWSRRAIGDILRAVRRDWEIPSFMSGRGAFKENDAGSHAEALLYLAFLADKPALIESAFAALAAGDGLRPRHLADAVSCLIELGQASRAEGLLESVKGRLATDPDSKLARVRTLCHAVAAAAAQDLERAQDLFGSVSPEVDDRAYNSVRIWLARGFLDAARPHDALKALRPLDERDGFAREQLAWLYLEMGDAERADKQLRYFLDRDDHKSGRNLANFLHGTALIRRGREDEAMDVFGHLGAEPWPRSWTLGSHYALGRLGGGNVAAYLKNAFSWERISLERHRRLLERARS